ncbi:nitrite reductase small subunit NirD [Paenibacillus sp. MMS20-IR301]|uniref:nitrite reductase small subunit NirD n=1 Tax=Paenibacillus sp. MMS20-IR301 TaxID=2895946 RepID=UPI0028EBAF86|nr:nitrite reductase small subunit NirD [Paenibacillus sp. MMS20-IR301]WNS44297.1 nitrite reductase small subunit NirD [Paenibacillus sp. MMS20-IR301]
MKLGKREYAVGAVEDFMPQIGRVVTAGEVELAVFRTSDGAVYAVENHSPHPKGGPLAEGIVSGYYLYDPLHDWKIDLRTGEVQAPDRGLAAVHPVAVEDGIVKVSLASAVASL